ncbi:MAG: 2OG-Fe(II) oxygenase family protein [Alphaproteobacteria bacterium]|nr:2OG-Fe(II) oxygenase family protein [Alphaproteobacteria bacterium]MBU0795822.1 2OG-Fe(II) oxygenase family protein [Alphaproteobacteria bacterium]MBU0886684.1 2OG-Fe(II) oxygenase family protein [Alphaproteobacteria bacterium]MBU1814539.1 2OG-Fe(II) oxygenase family protein [Alphaproteobacteria bacterium]MBU2091538.1 2OG-Fe(II) oxygenase family protein [Alphaproteobacteria bacterium]
MLLNTIIIDDFYQNPMEVRREALALTYPQPEGTVYYSGRNSRESMLPPETDRLFSTIVHEPVVGNRRMAHGRCRLALGGDPRPAEIHVDPNCVWAGIVYLTLPDYCQGGTEFFRNKEFGTERAPVSDEEARKLYGMPDRTTAVDTILGKDGRDLTKWDKILTLPMKFNRCVLFRPWLWHTSGPEFGTGPEDGRLIQLLFFQAGQPPAAARPPIRR